MHRVLPALVAAAPLTPLTNDPTQRAPAHDLAAVLHHRVTAWHDQTPPSQGGTVEAADRRTSSPQQEHLDDDIPVDQRVAIDQVEALITSRVDTVTRQLLANPPAWLTAMPKLSGANDPRQYTTVDPAGDPEAEYHQRRRSRERALQAARDTRDIDTRRPGR